MDNRIHIFAGHFGSGKTEIALNFAVKNAKDGKNVSIVDLDTVNPYFRTADAADIMKKYGIRVIASEFAATNVDIPTVPAETMSVFDNSDTMGIFDVGGDEDGAYALGRYRNEFVKNGYCMHFVVNTKRPLTQKFEDIIGYAEAVERASGLKITDIFNNTNLADETDTAVLMSGYDVIEKVSRIKNIPIACSCGTKNVLCGIDSNGFDMEIFIKMPWNTGKD